MEQTSLGSRRLQAAGEPAPPSDRADPPVSAERMRALLNSVRAFSRVREPAKVLQIITDTARELADAQYAALGVLGPGSDEFEDFIHSGMDPATVSKIGHLPRGKGILGAVIVEGRPLRLQDLKTHPASHGFPNKAHPDMTSFLGVPVVTSGGVVGNLYLTNKIGAPEFTASDEELIIALAAQAAVAIENARGYARETAMVGRLRRLVQANLALTTELRQEVILQQIVDLARELLDAQYAALGVLGPDNGRFQAFIHSGMPAEDVAKIGHLPRGLGVLRAVSVGRRTIRVADLTIHPASVGFPQHHPPMTSFLGVPLEYKGRVFGNLYVTNKIGAAEFNDQDELVATALAAQAAVVIENAAIYHLEEQLVQDLKRLNSSKTDFVNTVSHELRTPVATLMGLTEILQSHRDDIPAEDLDAALAGIRRQTLRLSELVRDLLDLSRIEAGRLDLTLRPVHLRESIDRVLATNPPPQGKQVSVDVGEDVEVLAEASHLDIAISNLLNNAYRHGGKHIVLSARPASGRVFFTVSDDGPGVPEDLRATMFEKFARGRATGATGLGLAILRGLAEAFGGEVWYEPNRPRGAKFTLDLKEGG